MGINKELAKKAEIIARKLAKQAGQPEELWELFLLAAYDEIGKSESSKPKKE